jgi:hypothetical protein
VGGAREDVINHEVARPSPAPAQPDAGPPPKTAPSGRGSEGLSSARQHLKKAKALVISR